MVTVLGSLLTSVGLCTLSGLMPTLNSGEVFPYLVVITGLENVLVLTKSVVSTPVDLKRKLRIAQGLSRESWSIMKTMVTELGIILVGYFTLMPATQEFFNGVFIQQHSTDIRGVHQLQVRGPVQGSRLSELQPS